MTTLAPESQPASPAGMTCHNCGREIPAGEFCGVCGAHLVADAPGAAHRWHAFAADPREHVLQLSVVSTLFPHLPHRHSGAFRLALFVAAALLVVLGLVRLTGPAIGAAAIVVPALYLLYLYDVEVYEDEPARVIGATVVLGIVLGVGWALLTGPLVTQTLAANVMLGVAPGPLVLAGVVLPWVRQALMLVGALVIYLTRRFDEALDGFTFGAAGALGFTFATTLVNLLPELDAGLVSPAPPTANALEVLQRGFLFPLVQASTSGLVAGALWLRRGRVRHTPGRGWTTSLVFAILVAAIVQAALGLVDVLATSAVVVAGAYAIAVFVLLLLVRIALHHMLLAEAAEVAIGPEAPCFHCHRVVPRMAFCPNCGIATRATPKTGVGRTGRAVR